VRAIRIGSCGRRAERADDTGGVSVSEKLRWGLTIALFVSAGLTLVVFSIIKAEDRWKMVLRWVLTAGLLLLVLKVLSPMLGLIAMVGFIPIWRRAIASLIANPVASLYTGGNTEPDPHPAYSVAYARRKQGKYHEAVMELLNQLERFPNDFEGQLALAEIQAHDLKDLHAAAMTIERLCAQRGHADKNIAFALYSMADWYIQIGHDGPSARRELEKIIELFPKSEFAAGAAHRIGHLANMEILLPPEQRKKFIVTEGPKNLGLQTAQAPAAPAEASGAEKAGEYVRHLEQHPLDADVREKLAVLYADHYHRLDLAADQLEQLIEQPGQPLRQIAHWLNLLADLQIRCGASYETVRQTIQRIVDREPAAPSAQVARNRLDRLKLEFKAREQNQSVKMGSYEQNIGLKNDLPRFQL
jgi:tetratricopeptide (TPR) repeat protein